MLLTRPAAKMFIPSGNYVSADLLNMSAAVGFRGISNSSSNASGDNKLQLTIIKNGLASAMTGTASKKGSAAIVSTVGATTALAVKTAAACTDPTEAVCISKHPTKCSASGALSTVATVGAAIAALAMSF